MPLDFVDLPIVRPVAWFFRVFLWELLITELFFSILCVPLGWVLCRVATAGRSPDESLRTCMTDEDGAGAVPGLVGFAVIALAFVLAFFLGGES